jgi:hypothetical protein
LDALVNLPVVAMMGFAVSAVWRSGAVGIGAGVITLHLAGQVLVGLMPATMRRIRRGAVAVAFLQRTLIVPVLAGSFALAMSCRLLGIATHEFRPLQPVPSGVAEMLFAVTTALTGLLLVALAYGLGSLQEWIRNRRADPLKSPAA